MINLVQTKSTMKKIALPIIALISLTISCKNSYETTDSSTLEIYADSLFNASVDSSKIAGATVIAFQNGKMLLNRSYGYASLELSVPVPDEAQFEIGSVTKQFTAAAILKLAGDKKLSLEDDFTKYLKFDTKGRKVTINNLLNHTSGIVSYTSFPDFGKFSIQQNPRDTLVRKIEKKGFNFEPGEALIYNNSGYFLLGLIIEKVSGMSYEEYLKESIFEPLGMENTSYCTTTEVVKNKVYGYRYSPKGLQQKAYLNHTWPYAAGSLCSTTKDILIWLRALHEGKILTQSQYQSIITPNPLNDGTPIQYAKGLMNSSNLGNHQISHGGGINGFLTETRYFPKEDLYIICLVNTIGPHGAGYFAEKITWKLLEKKATASVALDIDLTTLEGSYTGQARGRMLTFDVKPITNGVTIQRKGSKSIDTLNTYIGNNTWADGNTKFIIKNNEFRIDQTSAHYILKKEK